MVGAYLHNGEQTLTAAQKLRERGQDFASLGWIESPTMRRLGRLPAGVAIYSNAPEAVYLQTARPARRLPPLYNPFTDKPEPAYRRSIASLRERVRRGTP